MILAGKIEVLGESTLIAQALVKMILAGKIEVLGESTLTPQALVKMILAGKIEVLGESTLIAQICLSHTPQGLSWHLFPPIQGVTGGKVNIVGGLRIGHSKQTSVYVDMSYSERFPKWRYLTVQMQKLLIRKRYYVLF